MVDRIARIAFIAWRTVRVHVAVLVALVRHRRADRQEWETSPLAHPESGWEDDPDTLRNLPVVRVPERSGRHSKGEAA